MELSPAIIKEIERVLREFSTVHWDRFTIGENAFTLYGWIDRDGDEYKDFLLLRYFPWESDPDNSDFGEWAYTTSSVAIHDEIDRVFNGGRKNPSDNSCIRIEDHFNIPNSIKLK